MKYYLIIIALAILSVTVPVLTVILTSNQEQRHEQLLTTQR